MLRESEVERPRDRAGAMPRRSKTEFTVAAWLIEDLNSLRIRGASAPPLAPIITTSARNITFAHNGPTSR